MNIQYSLPVDYSGLEVNILIIINNYKHHAITVKEKDKERIDDFFDHLAELDSIYSKKRREALFKEIRVLLGDE